MFRLFSTTVPTHANPWLFIIGILLPSGLGYDGTGNQADQSESAYQQQLEAHLEVLSTRLGSLESIMQQQMTILPQILDHVSPPQIPPAWENRLKQLETQAGNLSRWPKDAGEAEQFLERMSELATSESAYQQQLEAHLEVLSARLGSFESIIQQQMTILPQILDHVSPPQIPPAWENRLKQLETQAGNLSRWPKDAGETEQFRELTSELVTDVPAWAEAHYLPRLTLVRWAAMAFVLLNYPTDNSQSIEQLAQLADEMRDLADIKPDGGSEALVRRLREKAAEVAGQSDNQRVKEIIAQAQKYIDGNPDATPDSASVYELLGLYEKRNNVVGVNVDIATLRKKMYEEMARRQTVEHEAILRTQWQNVQELARRQPQSEVYEVSVKMLLQQVMSAHAALVLEGIATTAYDGLENELRHAVETIESKGAERVEERQAKAIRSYQGWALSKVKAFDAAYNATEKKARENAKLLRADDGGWSYARYREVRMAMINHLLPINSALLDLPVQERYQRAFQTGWKMLDGREDQTSVAQASALTEKKSLREFLEEK